ncbi:MAG TPA: Hsp20 family protein [Opitutaceae bacterium]|nr:Hsp20 family protein [Opitutaceae bacterium]
MTTIIHPNRSSSRSRLAEPVSEFRTPNYDCREQADAVKLVVYVPGVDASGLEIEARGSDLIITARKKHFVRVNWSSLHLEGSQRDYRLRLRLGGGLDYRATAAEIRDGVLTLTLPKRSAELAPAVPRLRVA